MEKKLFSMKLSIQSAQKRNDRLYPQQRVRVVKLFTFFLSLRADGAGRSVPLPSLISSCFSYYLYRSSGMEKERNFFSKRGRVTRL